MDNRYRVLIICAVILCLGFAGTVSAKTWYVDANGGADFIRIQDAITAANASDTIIVRDGTYTENIDVNKRLTIRSENGPASTTVQASNMYDHVFEVTADYVNISGFTVEGVNASQFGYLGGIYLENVENCNISDNNPSNNSYGIYLYNSNCNILTCNTASLNSWDGISLYSSSNNTLADNTVSNNTDDGIDLSSSSNNTLVNNTLVNNGYGIYLSSSSKQFVHQHFRYSDSDSQREHLCNLRV